MENNPYKYHKINERLYYVDGAKDKPVPKISLINCGDFSVLVDVGNEEGQVESLNKMIKEFNLPIIKYVIITHFHDDHIHNIGHFSNFSIIATKYTMKYIKCIDAPLEKPMIIEAKNFNIKIDFLPNSHSKGALLIYEDLDKVMFIGDALCGRILGDKVYLNRSSTYEMIKKFNEYDVSFYVDGHSDLEETTKTKVEETLNSYKKLFKEHNEETLEVPFF
ncbi:MAG: MBL fold metallo-hydrolase [Bacilli bacterium]|jgi:glyoxylase-like metal-dependent hydrolase (beta-lactamase superfamily II)